MSSRFSIPGRRELRVGLMAPRWCFGSKRPGSAFPTGTKEEPALLAAGGEGVLGIKDSSSASGVELSVAMLSAGVETVSCILPAGGVVRDGAGAGDVAFAAVEDTVKTALPEAGRATFSDSPPDMAGTRFRISLDAPFATLIWANEKFALVISISSTSMSAP